jgi:anti-sigma regulatory factor (Ser/Thr protein kinase)
MLNHQRNNNQSSLNRHKRDIRSRVKKKVKRFNDKNQFHIKERHFYLLKNWKYPKRILVKRPKYQAIINKITEIKEIYAPEAIDFYDRTDYEHTLQFVQSMEDVYLTKKYFILINFSETKKITAAAMLHLIATIESLCTNKEELQKRISFTHPKNAKVASTLKHVGFYDLLHKKPDQTEVFDDVDFWQYEKGSHVDQRYVAESIQRAKKMYHLDVTKLYAACSEALYNVIEHAYSDASQSKNWWMFFGKKDHVFIVIVCNKGIGIPESIKNHLKKDDFNYVERFKDLLGHKQDDATYIRKAISYATTCTEQKNRGKGLHDVTNIVKTKKNTVCIFSNKGRVKYSSSKQSNKKIKEDNNKHSIKGTIIQWNFTLEEKKEI